MNRRAPLCILTAVAAASLLIPAVRADTYTWVGTTGMWDDPAHWQSGLIPPGTSADQLIFPDGTYSSTITAEHDPWVLNSITFPTFGNVTINSANTAGLQFDGPAPVIKFPSANSTDTVILNAPITLAQSLTVLTTFANNSQRVTQNRLTLAQTVSGPGGITLTSGNLTLAAANTFQGGVTLVDSPPETIPLAAIPVQLYVSNTQGLGTGKLTLDSSYGAVGAFFSPGTFTNDITVRGDQATVSNYGTPNGQAIALAFGHVTFDTPGTLNIGSFFQPSNVSFTFQGITLTGNTTLLLQSFYSQVDPGTITEAGGPSRLTFGGEGTFNLNHANTYTGGTVLSDIGTTVNANVTGAIPAGPVSMASGNILALNAVAAGNGAITGSAGTSVQYNANGAAGGHSITAMAITIPDSVTSTSSGGGAADTFSTVANGTFSAPGPLLAQLVRNTSLILGDGTTLVNIDGGLPPVQNLGTSADLFLGLAQDFSGDLTMGNGTPWRGINETRHDYSGNITANSDLTFSHTFLGSAHGFNILRGTSPQPVTVTLIDTQLVSSLGNYSGVDHFHVVGDGVTVTLVAPNALGGGSGTSPVPLINDSSLTIANPAALNGNVTLHAGSSFIIDSTGLTGTGVVSRDSQPMTFGLGNSQALSGTQLTPAFIQPGDTVDLDAENIVGLNAINPAAHYVVTLFMPSLHEAQGLNLSGGSLVFGNRYQALVPGPAAQGDSTIHVGSAGATLAGPGSSMGILTNGDSAIEVPILAQGPVNLGFANAATDANTFGALVLTSTANQFQALTVNGIAVVATSPQALTGANITLNGGVLALVSNAARLSPATLYPNTITVTANSTIQDNTSNLHPASVSVSDNHRLALATVNVANATLTFAPAYGNLTLSTLNINGNANITLANNQFGASISAISHSGVAPMSLTLNQGVPSSALGFTLLGPVDVAGPITVASRTSVEVDGTVAFDPAAFTINAGTLMGNGTIHRAVIFSGLSNESLTPERYPASGMAPGTLVVDSLSLSPFTTTTLFLSLPNSIGGSSNDLIAVASNLTLDGTLRIQNFAGIGPGTYTLFTYGGTLTDNGLLLPTIAGDTLALDLSTPGQVNLHVSAAAPEPASLALALPTTFLLLRKRRPA